MDSIRITTEKDLEKAFYIRKEVFIKDSVCRQTQAEGFYEKLGYRTASDVFMDAGIPHILMVKELPAKGVEK
ncbi:putative GNAT family N-acyltransferase [Bacillus benzoevorans]|uniref:Putative GNAT family N-acyltransferase n=1 Tax=Bacillus benzoevorans TaxID=1456 RepID=A0A7X0LXV9_9BACI|nr:putative GNAT family N-acyltransferase [Bacillus benzoevorans]